MDNALLSCGPDGGERYDLEMNWDLAHKGHTSSFCFDQTGHYMVDERGSVKNERRMLYVNQVNQSGQEILCRFQYPDEDTSFISAHNNIIVAISSKKFGCIQRTGRGENN